MTLPDPTPVAHPAHLRERLRDTHALSVRELVEIKQQAVNLRREADLILAQIAAEIARRSTPEDGPIGIARRYGHPTPQSLVAGSTGGTLAEAGRLVEMGNLLTDASAAPRDDSNGNDAPVRPAFPSIAAALHARLLSIDAASLLRRALAHHPEISGAPEPHSELAKTPFLDVEAQAVSKARHLDLAGVRRLAHRLEADLSPDAYERRYDELRQARGAGFREDSDGMITLTARLDPVTAAPLKNALDTYVRHAFQAQRDNPDDRRTAWQMRADALAWLAGHATTCDADHTGVKTSVVVRMDLKDLQRFEREYAKDGVNSQAITTGSIDGLAQPVPASALRALAADAEFIPVVLNGPSEVLDLGRAQRLFTRAQRLALVERDGGCAYCHAPPSYCDAHHIKWWSRDTGPTDLNNGVLLCVSCHHRIHRDGWEIEVRGDQVWFTPPASVDPERTPRLGGRAAREVRAA